MNVKELKSEFHKIINNFEDEKNLNNFYEGILEYSKKNKCVDIIDELSGRQKERLMNSIEQVKEGKTISNGKVKMKFKNELLIIIQKTLVIDDPEGTPR